MKLTEMYESNKDNQKIMANSLNRYGEIDKMLQHKKLRFVSKTI